MKSFKKIISILAVISLLATSVFTMSIGTVSATTTPDIRLHSTELVARSARGTYTRVINIKVKDTERYGRVYAHVQGSNNNWYDVEATKTNLKSQEGYSIYQATFSTNTRSSKFALKYDYVAAALWDNNYTKDFTDLTLGYNENVRAERTEKTYSNYYNVSAILRNISYAKEVKCVYSEDNFKTKKTINLNYKEMINSTTSYGSQTERWTGKITGIKNTSNLQYYLTYKVSGKTYTDNNLGQYYSYYFTTTYEPY